MRVEPIMTQCMLEEYSCWTKGNVLIVLCRTALLWTPPGLQEAKEKGQLPSFQINRTQMTHTHELHDDPLKALCHQYLHCCSSVFQISSKLTFSVKEK